MRIPVASVLGALALALLASIAVRTSAHAATPTGLDVSWPQCGKQLPMTPLAFAVVGVDNGKAFTSNPCFAEQYRWAGSTGTLPALYFTLRSPQGATAARGFEGPAGVCAASDARCIARNYGYHAAREARAYAVQQAGPPPSTMWWLDIETMSHWSTDQAANAEVVRGAIEYLKEQGVLFGVYSTRTQWNQITGGLALPEGLPLWIAGAHDKADAPTMCTPRYAFGGGQLWLVQYIANNLDHNHVCGEPMSVTILTRTVSSAMATTSAAVRVPAPETPPTPLPIIEAAVLPSVPAELAHLGGAGLVTLPVRATTAPRTDGCTATAAPTVAADSPSKVGGDADRPRHRHASRRRRPA
ncbi:MAG: hypothetical protein WC211_09740 [Dehalococcoidia bacterium]